MMVLGFYAGTVGPGRPRGPGGIFSAFAAAYDALSGVVSRWCCCVRSAHFTVFVWHSVCLNACNQEYIAPPPQSVQLDYGYCPDRISS